MPEWFVNLAYIVFAVIMVAFLIGVVVFMVAMSAVCIREARRRKGGRNV